MTSDPTTPNKVDLEEFARLQDAPHHRHFASNEIHRDGGPECTHPHGSQRRVIVWDESEVPDWAREGYEPDVSAGSNNTPTLEGQGLFPERAEHWDEGFDAARNFAWGEYLSNLSPHAYPLNPYRAVVAKPLDLGDGTAPPEENFWDDRTTPLASSEHESEDTPWGPATTA